MRGGRIPSTSRSRVSTPLAPAFMRSAPPIVPRNAMEEGEAAEPLFPCEGRERLVGQRRAGAEGDCHRPALACPKPLAERRITAPGTPPSRTRRLEPTPMTTTGIAQSIRCRNSDRSSSSAG